jgi:predicted alpha/beta-fold hydrolase
VAPRHGGHVSFLAKGKPRFWLDAAALGWLENYGNK